jgi:hypothetical protein
MRKKRRSERSKLQSCNCAKATKKKDKQQKRREREREQKYESCVYNVPPERACHREALAFAVGLFASLVSVALAGEQVALLFK